MAWLLAVIYFPSGTNPNFYIDRFYYDSSAAIFFVVLAG